MKDFKMNTSSQHRQPETHEDVLRDRAFHAQMLRELYAHTKPHLRPSVQIEAWRNYERCTIEYMGHNPRPAFRSYNLQTDTVNPLQWAHDVLTRPSIRKLDRVSKKAAPRRALTAMARAFGFRYMRGLEAIEHGLDGANLDLFKHERQAFSDEFKMSADAAHAVNSKGENPAFILELVQMFTAELKALVSWLEKAGKPQEAAMLLEAAQSIGAREYDED